MYIRKFVQNLLSVWTKFCRFGRSDSINIIKFNLHLHRILRLNGPKYWYFCVWCWVNTMNAQNIIRSFCSFSVLWKCRSLFVFFNIHIDSQYTWQFYRISIIFLEIQICLYWWMQIVFHIKLNVRYYIL